MRRRPCTRHQGHALVLEAVQPGLQRLGGAHWWIQGLGHPLAEDLIEFQQGPLKLCGRGGHRALRIGAAASGTGHPGQQCAEDAAGNAHRIGVSCGGPWRHQHRPVDPWLHPLGFKPCAGGRPGVPEQARHDARGHAQQDRALHLEHADHTGGLPQGTGVHDGPHRIRFGRDMRLPIQRGGESLQLAQLPLGRGVNKLHGARNLDIDLDTRLVHQFQFARLACARGRRADRALQLLKNP